MSQVFSFLLSLFSLGLWGAEVPVSTRLREAVLEYQKKLGSIPAWQQKIFEEEILPNGERFVRDYRSSGSSLNIVVNEDGIRKYLLFHAPTVYKRTDSRVLLCLQLDGSCPECQSAQGSLQKTAQAALERRGWQVEWLKPASCRVAHVQLKEILVAQKEPVQAALCLGLRLLPPDLDDIAHADEKHYELKAVSFLRYPAAGLPALTQAPPLLREEGKLEVLSVENVAAEFLGLIGNLHSELGAKWNAMAQVNTKTTGAGEGISLEVGGIADFNQFAALKKGLQESLAAGGAVSERQLRRGQVVFDITGFSHAQDLRNALSAIAWNGVIEKLIILEAKEKWIRAEIQK